MLIHKHTLRKYKTERRGFEPPDAFTSPVFKTGALNRSATFPILSDFEVQLSHFTLSSCLLPLNIFIGKNTFFMFGIV